MSRHGRVIYILEQKVHKEEKKKYIYIYIYYEGNSDEIHLVSRAKQICSPNLLSEEIGRIKGYICWNGFPKQVGNRIIINVLRREQHGTPITQSKKLMI